MGWPLASVEHCGQYYLTTFTLTVALLENAVELVSGTTTRSLTVPTLPGALVFSF